MTVCYEANNQKTNDYKKKQYSDLTNDIIGECEKYNFSIVKCNDSWWMKHLKKIISIIITLHHNTMFKGYYGNHNRTKQRKDGAWGWYRTSALSYETNASKVTARPVRIYNEVKKSTCKAKKAKNWYERYLNMNLPSFGHFTDSSKKLFTSKYFHGFFSECLCV